MTWLDAQADGIAFMLAVLSGMAAMLLFAGAIEWWKGRGMRRRRRQREAYARYVAAVDAQARTLSASCWQGPEARP